MFYEALGGLLGQAGDAMTQPGFGKPGDARAARAARQIALLLIRVRTIWPSLFSSLIDENAVLRRGLETANATLRARGLDAVEVDDSRDPFESHRDLERGLDRVIETLASRIDEEWASLCLATVRKELVASAEIQGRLVDEMLAIRLPAAGGHA